MAETQNPSRKPDLFSQKIHWTEHSLTQAVKESVSNPVAPTAVRSLDPSLFFLSTQRDHVSLAIGMVRQLSSGQCIVGRHDVHHFQARL